MVIDERLVTYLTTLEKEKPDWLMNLEAEALAAHVPIIRRQTQNLLRFLLHLRKPQRILEIGAAVGFSSLLMKEYAPSDCTLTTIEKVEMRLVEARKNLKIHDPEGRIELIEGDANDVLPTLVEHRKQYDFIFMDAAKGQYMNFLEPVRELLSPEGLLITDNVLQEGEILESRYAVNRRDRTIHGRMRDYLKTLTQSEEWDSVVLPMGDGMALSVKLDMDKNQEDSIHGTNA